MQGYDEASAKRPTQVVRAFRERTAYEPCPVCAEGLADYLFFAAGVRFVRCRACELVYASPVGAAFPDYFEMASGGRLSNRRDRSAAADDLEGLLLRLAHQFSAARGRMPRRLVLLGRQLPELLGRPALQKLGLALLPLEADALRSLCQRGDASAIAPHIEPETDLLVLSEVLEACARPRALLEALGRLLPERARLAVTYADVASWPARLLRRHWSGFFDERRAYYALPQLARLFSEHHWVLSGNESVPQHRTARYLWARAFERAPAARRSLASLPALWPLRFPAGLCVASFERRPAAPLGRPREKLSIVLPAFQEAKSVRRVIEAVLAKPLRIDKELIIVESGSTDGTREIVSEYAAREGVRVVLEPGPRGKGHAVRAGLSQATGSIVLIQDADLEYDIEDYDALLEPILQGRTSFVLGSRTLGADDWKVRKFAHGAVSAALLNVAQVGFAKTFNLLYGQRTTDVNTMFKVFRRECLAGFSLESDGFELDIELCCKLARSGYVPLEVPVNYVARDFVQGKKIRFLRDALPSYAAFFRFRSG